MNSNSPSITDTISASWIHLFSSDAPLPFEEWKKKVRAAFGKGAAPSDSQLVWAWESIRKSPWAASMKWRMAPASHRWKEPIPALPKDTILQLVLDAKPKQQLHTLLTGQRTGPRVVLSDEWRLVRGKGDRLEGAGVRCTVLLRPKDLVGDQETESARCVVAPERIRIAVGLIEVSASSLNEAYAIASRRLEPKRRSHGGRVYDRMFIEHGKGWMSLEDVRSMVEAGTWSPSADKK